MNPKKFEHEESQIFIEARETFRALVRLGQSNIGWLNSDVRRHARRLLEHAAAAGDAPSSALRNQSLRYAKLSALKLCATVEGALLEQQLSEAGYALARHHLGRVLAELGSALPLSANGEAVSHDANVNTPDANLDPPESAQVVLEDEQNPGSRPTLSLEHVSAAGTS